MKRHDVETASFRGDTSNGFFGSRGGGSALMRVCAWVLASLALLLPALGSAQALNVKGWQDTIKKTPPAKTGCFVASYPGMQWQPTACADARADLFDQRRIQEKEALSLVSNVGSGVYGAGYPASVAAEAPPIKSAEGSFLSVSGVTDITDSRLGGNFYSLQINTEYFILSNGEGFCPVGPCIGWVQFIYTNWGSENSGQLIFEHMLQLGDDSPCPNLSSSSVVKINGACYYEDDGPVVPGGLPINANFDSQTFILRGQTGDGMDIVTMFVGGQAYALVTSSMFPNLPQIWRNAQFNIYGFGNGSQVNFNPGASLIVYTKIDNGTTDPPTCKVVNNAYGSVLGTAEWNNLNFKSPCCSFGGGAPSITFVEGIDPKDGFASYGNNAIPNCAPLGDNTITPVIAPAGGGTISPSVALHVPNKAISTFTLTPNAGYKVASVTARRPDNSDCGGASDDTKTVFTTAPASGDCTVTATFTAAQTYTVTASATTNGTISSAGGGINPSGSANVVAGTTRTFTIVPQAGYSLSSVVGGTCGGTLSGPVNKSIYTYTGFVA